MLGDKHHCLPHMLASSSDLPVDESGQACGCRRCHSWNPRRLSFSYQWHRWWTIAVGFPRPQKTASEGLSIAPSHEKRIIGHGNYDVEGSDKHGISKADMTVTSRPDLGLFFRLAASNFFQQQRVLTSAVERVKIRGAIVSGPGDHILLTASSSPGKTADGFDW